MHDQFEELCALAATGQISGEAMLVLEHHVKECDACRTFLQDVVPLKAHIVPVMAGALAQGCEPPQGARERFLQRAAEAGLHLTPGPVIAEPFVATGTSTLSRERPNSFAVGLDRFFNSLAFRFAAPLTAGIICGALGFFYAAHQTKPADPVSAVAPAPVTSGEKQTGALAMPQDHAESADAERRFQAISAELIQVQAEKKGLEEKLVLLTKQASTDLQFEQQFKSVAQQLQSADNLIGKLQSDLESERRYSAIEAAIAITQRKSAEEANAQLASLQTQVAREREMYSAKGMAGEVISARNLHIVDVYDSGNEGDRKHTFGRVFYVEGRSLVFYAYDLPRGKHPDKVVFRVWGEQPGAKMVSLNLGVMHNDNPAQSRWVLTCDDPKMLAKINAVYITADPHARPESDSRSQKMMYAFLGSPNHP
jgi:hypothetical protein